MDIFETWYTFGGMQRGISPMEAQDMPPEMRHDFTYIMRIIGDERDKARRSRKRKKTS